MAFILWAQPTVLTVIIFRLPYEFPPGSALLTLGTPATESKAISPGNALRAVISSYADAVLGAKSAES